MCVVLASVPGFFSRGANFTRHSVYVNRRVSSTSSSRTLIAVPKLWNETIEAHRRAVRDAILDTTAALVAEHGLRSVTMSQIAEQTGIGRATLYKYFPDVEAILLAWHERQVTGHLGQLAEVRDQAGDAGERLEAVLEAYALISHESRGHHGTELAALLHRGEHVARAQQQLTRHDPRPAGRGRSRPAPSGPMSRPTSSRATASTPSAAAGACRPRPRSAGSSRSPWPGCATVTPRRTTGGRQADTSTTATALGTQSTDSSALPATMRCGAALPCELITTSGPPQLLLITCAGPYRQGSGHRD